MKIKFYYTLCKYICIFYINILEKCLILQFFNSLNWKHRVIYAKYILVLKLWREVPKYFIFSLHFKELSSIVWNCIFLRKLVDQENYQITNANYIMEIPFSFLNLFWRSLFDLPWWKKRKINSKKSSSIVLSRGYREERRSDESELYKCEIRCVI